MILSDDKISALLADPRLQSPRDLARAVEAEVLAALKASGRLKKPKCGPEIVPNAGGGPGGGTPPR
jgi:hypothetical protein